VLKSVFGFKLTSSGVFVIGCILCAIVLFVWWIVVYIWEVKTTYMDCTHNLAIWNWNYIM